jgi:hypothetical protein
LLVNRDTTAKRAHRLRSSLQRSICSELAGHWNEVQLEKDEQEHFALLVQELWAHEVSALSS